MASCIAGESWAYFTNRWLQTPDNPNPFFEVLRDNKVIQVIYPVSL